MITAEKVYREIVRMPVKERERLFAEIARKGFEKDVYSYNEVFGNLRDSPFTLIEAADELKHFKKVRAKKKSRGKDTAQGDLPCRKRNASSVTS